MTQQRKETAVPEELQEYIVDIGGLPHTLLLDKAAAERYGEAAKKVTAKAAAPANKARAADSK